MRTILQIAVLLTLSIVAVNSQEPGIRILGDELRNSKNISIRRKAAEALGRANTEQSVTILSQARREEGKMEVRLAILRALRQITFLRSPGYREAIDAIGEAADDDFETDTLVSLRATEALWEAGKKDLLDPVPILDRQLKDRSQRIRIAAVKMLRKHGSPHAADVLGKVALDKQQSETIRLEAIESLGAVALPEGGDAGRQVAASNINVMKLFGAAPLVSEATLEKRHNLQISYLATILRDPENSVTLTIRAVKSIGNVKDRSAIPVLREVIESHPHDGIRKQATRVLSHILARQYE